MKKLIVVLFFVFIFEDGLAKNSKYKFFTKQKTWFGARESCINNGGHLAIIDSQEEQQDIQAFLASQTGQTTWIHMGFHMLFGGDVIDLFGKELVLKDWDIGQPDSTFKGEKCGSIMNIRTLLNDIDCGGLYTYICEFPTDKKNLSFPELTEEKIYRINKQLLTWPAARRFCRNNGGHLVIFETKDELDQVLGDVIDNNIQWFWAGYHNVFKSDEIVLENGEVPQEQYLKWKMGCDKTQKYGAVSQNGKTNLVDPNTKYPSVCEISKPKCYVPSQRFDVRANMALDQQ